MQKNDFSVCVYQTGTRKERDRKKECIYTPTRKSIDKKRREEEEEEEIMRS
jgi:hypothetical protein